MAGEQTHSSHQTEDLGSDPVTHIKSHARHCMSLAPVLEMGGSLHLAGWQPGSRFSIRMRRHSGLRTLVSTRAKFTSSGHQGVDLLGATVLQVFIRMREKGSGGRNISRVSPNTQFSLPLLFKSIKPTFQYYPGFRGVVEEFVSGGLCSGDVVLSCQG